MTRQHHVPKKKETEGQQQEYFCSQTLTNDNHDDTSWQNLESALSGLTREFPNPNVRLEQYPTSPYLAARVMQTIAHEHDDSLPSFTLCDLGCGTGMLSIAAAFFCDAVWAIDCDIEAMDIAQQNARKVDLEDCIHFIQAQVHTKKPPKLSKAQQKQQQQQQSNKTGRRRGGGRGSANAATSKAQLILNHQDGIPLSDNSVDVVVTNPPFGTKHNAGMDLQFVRTACRLATQKVYSFHKRSTRSFLLRTIQNDWQYSNVHVAAELEFDVPLMYAFHQEASKNIEVDLLCIDVTSHQNNHVASPGMIGRSVYVSNTKTSSAVLQDERSENTND